MHKKFVEQRKQLAVQLAQLIHQKAAIAYFDKSSFNFRMRHRHTHLRTMAQLIKLVINERQMGGMTVYGAISLFLKRFVLMLGTST